MKKKIIICISLIFMLLAISFATAVNTNATTNKNKESPLFKTRTNQAIKEKIQNIKTNLIGDKIFFLPFTLFKNNEQPLIRALYTMQCNRECLLTSKTFLPCTSK